MKLLLDTHTFLWWISDSERLSDRARQTMADGRNTLFFSAASGWELAIKVRLGRLTVREDLARFIPDQLVQNAIEVLPVHLSHALRVATLPDHHRDPFDRLLVAQSLVEDVPILSADPHIAQYPVQVIW